MILLKPCFYYSNFSVWWYFWMVWYYRTIQYWDDLEESTTLFTNYYYLIFLIFRLRALARSFQFPYSNTSHLCLPTSKTHMSFKKQLNMFCSWCKQNYLFLRRTFCPFLFIYLFIYYYYFFLQNVLLQSESIKTYFSWTIT